MKIGCQIDWITIIKTNEIKIKMPNNTIHSTNDADEYIRSKYKLKHTIDYTIIIMNKNLFEYILNNK